MKILYLYAEVMGYTLATIKSLAERGLEVHVVHWDKKKLTAFQVDEVPGVHFYARSTLTLRELKALAYDLRPAITVVSGWQDLDYLSVARSLRRLNKTVVVGFDDQWHGKYVQHIASLFCKFGFLSRYYSHAWVSGPYQYEYARRLNFKKKNIVYDLYSADLELYHAVYHAGCIPKQASYPHRFLYVGRLEPIKGLETLVSAWNLLGSSRGDWELHLVGSGSLRPRLEALPGIVVKDFMQPKQLIGEVRRAGCFVLPSHGEPWGVVVHEFAAAGLPLILSSVIGAAAEFLIVGFNGFTFPAKHSDALAECMRQVILKSDEELMEMGHRSFMLSTRITPETSAANLLATELR